MPFEVSLYTVKAAIILNNDGKRLFSKYYKPPHSTKKPDEIDELFTSNKKQLQFESTVFSKTWKQESDISLIDGYTVVYKQFSDAIVYIVGDLDENECLLYNVLQGLLGAFEIILKNSIDKKSIMDGYDMIILAFDEAIDDGIVLEMDSAVIASRVTKPPTEDVTNIKIDLSEKGLFNAFNLARSKLSGRIQQGF